MTKTLNQIIFFPPPKSEYLKKKKKKHNPPPSTPLEVKWSVPNITLRTESKALIV